MRPTGPRCSLPVECRCVDRAHLSHLRSGPNVVPSGGGEPFEIAAVGVDAGADEHPAARSSG